MSEPERRDGDLDEISDEDLEEFEALVRSVYGEGSECCLELADVIHALVPALRAARERLEAEKAKIPRLREIERCAAGVVRTAHPDITKHSVVREWWTPLVIAVASAEPGAGEKPR